MPASAVTIPPWPGHGAPGRRKAFVAAINAAAGGADWAAVAGALSAVPTQEVPPGLVPGFLSAALQLDDPAYLSAAVRAAIVANLRPELRARMAWRLAFALRPQEAWHVLHADPSALAEPAAHGVVLQLLGRIAAAPGAPPELRTAAAALARRHANRTDVPPIAAPHAFAPGPTVPRPGPGAARIVAAPGTPPPLLQAYGAAVAGFEATLARRPAPEVSELRDVLVNRLGQIWLPDGRVVQDQGLAIPAASRAAAAAAPTAAEGVLALETHNSLYHWLADWLPSIAWRFEPGVPRIPLLIRDDAQGFVTDSLRMVGGGDLPLLGVGDAARVGRLFLGSFGAGTIAPLGAHRRMLDAIAAAADALPAPMGGTPRRLYISRRDSRKRAMENEAALEAAIGALGFQPVMLTPLSLIEKVRLIRGAEVIAGPHGAGLGLILFARPGASVFEIMPGSLAGAQLTACMTRLSRLMGHRHLLWLEAQNPVTGRWSANLPAMLPALEAFAAEAPPVR